MIMLVEHETASDGEAVADGFRRLGLGPVLGVRTWGGEIWLSGTNTLSRRRRRAGADERRVWTGREVADRTGGRDPDIIVDNLPHATFNGRDAQLEAAIAYLQKKIAEARSEGAGVSEEGLQVSATMRVQRVQ